MHAIAKTFLVVFLTITMLCACSPNSSDSQTKQFIIEATGDNFNWHFRYPGVDGVLGNNDDWHSIQNLFLPTQTNITIRLKSKDYIYSFALPELNLKQVAVPDIDVALEFKTDSETTLQLLGDQFCGFAHDTLIGKVHILDQGGDFYQLEQISPHLTQQNQPAKALP